MDAFITYIKDHWIKITVCVVIGTVLMITYVGSKGGWASSYAYMDGCFISAGTLIGLSFLSVVNNFGAFDLFSYFIRRHKTEDGPENYGDYATRRAGERAKARWGFLPYFVIGLCFLIPSIVLMTLR